MANQSTKQPAGSIALICESFRHFPKNTLIGFATLVFQEIGLRVRDCTVHVEEDRRMWIGWPRMLRDGSWEPIIEATDRPAHFRLQAVAVKAVRKYLDALQTPPPEKSSTKAEIPDFPI
jgi:hypothetical protein